MSSDKNKYSKEDDNLIHFPFQGEQTIESENETQASAEQPVTPDSKVELKLVSSNESEDKTQSPTNKWLKFSESSYAIPAVACSLFLMLVGIPFLNAPESPTGQRDSASVREQEKVLGLIKRGRREIASVGRKPSDRIEFSMGLLGSQYKVRWRRGQLKEAVLLPEGTPVDIPSTEEIIEEFPSLFPEYAQIQKEEYAEGDLSIYTLKDQEGFDKVQVETLRDEEGRLLSIFVNR